MGFNWKEKAATSKGKQIVGRGEVQSGTISNKDMADIPSIILINFIANYIVFNATQHPLVLANQCCPERNMKNGFVFCFIQLFLVPVFTVSYLGLLVFLPLVLSSRIFSYYPIF